MSSYLPRTIAILCTLIAAILCTKIPIAHADLLLTVLVALVYTGTRRFHKTISGNHYLSDTLLFVFIATSIIFSTGTLDSPFFFLIYCMLFGAGLLLDWVACLTIALGLMTFFIADGGFLVVQSHLLQLMSLLLMIPFSIILSREHTRLGQIETAYSQEKTDDILFLSIIIKGHLQSLSDLSGKISDTEVGLDVQKTVARTKKLIDTFIGEE